jgi:hypothetical protein
MKCSTENCQGDARWRPVFLTRAKKNGTVRKVWLDEIAVCDDHKASDDINNFLSDEGFVKLYKHMIEHGLPAPVQKLTVLDWEEVFDEDIEPITLITIPQRDRDDELAF